MEYFQMLSEACGEYCMSLIHVFGWHTRLNEGHQMNALDDLPLQETKKYRKN